MFRNDHTKNHHFPSNRRMCGLDVFANPPSEKGSQKTRMANETAQCATATATKGRPPRHEQTMGGKMTHILPAIIAVTGIVVAQLHGVPFWIALFGGAPLGWTVSLLWEACSVWLWWRRDAMLAYQIAKWTATAALMVGMIGQSAGPLLTQAGAAETGERTLAILERQAAAGHWISQRTLKHALAATEGLPSWVLTWGTWGLIVIMPALYGLALLSLTTIAREWKNSDPKPTPTRTNSEGSPNSPESPEPAPKKVLADYGQRHGLTKQKEVAKRIKVAESTLSEFANGKIQGELGARIRARLVK